MPEDPLADFISGIRETEKLREIEEFNFQANVEDERNLASHLRVGDKTSFQPAVEAVKGTIFDVAAGTAQLLGLTDRAAALKGQRRAIGQASFEELQRVADNDPDIIGAVQTTQNVANSALRNVVLAGAGAPFGAAAQATTLIGGSGLLTGAETFTQRKLEGETTGTAFTSGATSGIIEAGITALFQRGGLGGIESQAIKTQFKDTVRNSLHSVVRDTGKQFGAELLEEASIAELDKIAQTFIVGKGVDDLQDPKFWADLEEELTQVLIETGITAGLAEGLKGGARKRDFKQKRQEFEDLVAEEKGKLEAADLRRVQDAAIAVAEQGVIKAEKLEADLSQREARRTEQQLFEQKEEALDAIAAQNAALRGEIDQNVQNKALKRQELLATIAAEAAVDNAIVQGLQELNVRRDAERANRQVVLQNADVEVAKRELGSAAEAIQSFFPDAAADREIRNQVEQVQTLEDAIALDEIIQERIDNIPIEHGEAKAALQVRLNDARAQGQLEGEAHIQALQFQEQQAEELDLETQIAEEQAFEEGQIAAEREFIAPKKRKPRQKKGPVKRPVQDEFTGPEFRPAESAPIDEFATLEDLTTPQPRKRAAPKKAAPAPTQPTPRKPSGVKGFKVTKGKPAEFVPRDVRVQAEELLPRGVTAEQLAPEVARVEKLAQTYFGEDADFETRKNHVLVTLPNGRRIGIFTVTSLEAARELAESPSASFASMKAKGIDPGFTIKQWAGLGVEARAQILSERGILPTGFVIPNPKSEDVIINLESSIFLTDGQADLSTLEEEAVHDAFIGLLTDTQLDTVNKELIRLGRLQEGGNNLRNDADFIEEGYELYREWLQDRPVGFTAKVKNIFKKVFKFASGVSEIQDVFERIRTGEVAFQEQVAPTTPEEVRRPGILEKRKPAPVAGKGALVTETVVARAVEEQRKTEEAAGEVSRAAQIRAGEELLKREGEDTVLNGIRQKLKNDQPLDLSEQRALSSLIKNKGRELDNIAQEENPDTFFKKNEELIDLLRLREQQGSLVGRSLEAFKDGTPLDKRAFVLGTVFSLNSREQQKVTALENKGEAAKAFALTKRLQKKHYRDFVKFLKNQGVSIEDINSDKISEAIFFSLVAKTAEAAKEGQPWLGLLNVIARNWIFGVGTIGKIAVTNQLALALSVSELTTKGAINLLFANQIKSIPTTKEAREGLTEAFTNFFSGFRFIGEAFTTGGNPQIDKLKGFEFKSESEQKQAQGFEDEIEVLFPASDKRLHVQALRKLFLGIAFPTRALTSLDQVITAPLIGMLKATLPQQEARALKLEGDEKDQFLQFVDDPDAIRREGIAQGLVDKPLDEFVKEHRARVEPVIQEIESEVRKVTASLAFDPKTFFGRLGKNLEGLLNTSFGKGFRPLRFPFPVFRGPVRGVEFAGRRSPIASALFAIADYARYKADPTNKRKRELASQGILTIVANSIPFLIAGLLSDEEEEKLLKGDIGGVDVNRLPLAGEILPLYGEYINLVNQGDAKAANQMAGRMLDMAVDATPARTVAKVAFSKDKLKAATAESLPFVTKKKGELEFKPPAVIRDVHAQVSGDKSLEELTGVKFEE